MTEPVLDELACHSRLEILRVGPRGRTGVSAVEAAVLEGVLPPGSTHADLVAWLQSGFLPAALQQTVGWAVARGFTPGADCTSALEALLEQGMGNWRIPPNDPSNPYFISADLGERLFTAKNVDARGCYFKRTWAPGTGQRAAMLRLLMTGASWIGGTFDFGGQSMTALSSALDSWMWAAVELAPGSSDSVLDVVAWDVPGYGVWVDGAQGNPVLDCNVRARSRGSFGSLGVEWATGGKFRSAAKDSTNRFGPNPVKQLVNRHAHVTWYDECVDIDIAEMLIDGVRGRRNPSYSIFFSGLTLLNCTRPRVWAPFTTGMWNDEAADADCMNLLAQSYPSEDYLVVAPRHQGAANLAMEFILTEGGARIINPVSDQQYVRSRVNSKCQGIVFKNGGRRATPDRSGRNCTVSKVCLVTDPISARCDGDAIRWRMAGVQLSGQALALGATGWGHQISHLDVTTAGFGLGYAPQPELDRAFPNLVAEYCGKTGIAINNGLRLSIAHGRGLGCGWNARRREDACGIGHIENSDEESDTGTVNLIIDGGDYRGVQIEVRDPGVSFTPGLGTQVLPGTPWADADQRFVYWPHRNMGRLGAMYRVRDVMGAGVDALIRVIDQNGDKGGIVTKPLQELTGTHDYATQGRILTGHGSAYLTELAVGTEIYALDGTSSRIGQVLSDTQAVLEENNPFSYTFVGRKLERVLADAPPWRDGAVLDVAGRAVTDVSGNPVFDTGPNFHVPLSGTVRITAGIRTLTGMGTSFLTEFKGPCHIRVGADVYAVAGVTTATSLVLMSPGARVAVNGVKAFMVLAPAETFNPQIHSLRFDADFVDSLQLLDPVVGATIREPVEIPTDRVAGPSRIIFGSRRDFRLQPSTAGGEADVLTLPAGWRLLGASARVVEAVSGRTGATSLDLAVKDSTGAILATLGSMAAVAGVIPKDAVTRGSHNLYAAFAAPGALRLRSTGGANAWTEGQVNLSALMSFDAPPYPASKGAQVL